MTPCSNCVETGQRLTKLETDSEWMQAALEDIRANTAKVSDYARELVSVAHETQTMSKAVGRAFDEIQRERAERQAEINAIKCQVAPIANGWSEVSDNSKWFKIGAYSLAGIVIILAIFTALNLKP